MYTVKRIQQPNENTTDPTICKQKNLDGVTETYQLIANVLQIDVL